MSDGSKTDLEYDVVAVHGLHADSESTWGNSSERLTQNLFSGQRVRIMSYDYYKTDTLGGIYTRKRFSEEALKLLERLVGWRAKSQKVQEVLRPLIFVTHDVGAIIALILAHLDSAKFGCIFDSTVSLVTFGCPHRCTSFQNMEENFVRLLLAHPRSFGNRITRVAQLLAESTIEVNDAFIDTKLLVKLTMINVYSTIEDSSKQVFDYFTATLNTPFESRVSIDGSHMDLVKILDRSINPVADCIRRGLFLCNIDPGMTQYLPKLLSQASPIYPFQAANDPSHPASEMSWINEDKIFTNWLTRKDSSNLQVHGISNISRVGEYIFQHLDSLIVSSTDHPILYFEFKQSDARFNTLNSMLSTFLAQIISHYPKLNDMAVQNIKLLLLHRSWTTKDLYAFFECLRATRQICGLTYVINRLDLCIEPFDWFLKELSSIHTCSESRFKAVIISKRTQQILDVPFQSLSINVDDHDENDKPNSDALLSTVHFGLDVLFQEHPQYCRFELTLAEVFSECGQDIHLCQLIVDWLRFGEHSTAILSIEKILQTLSPPSPKKVLETIMASIGLERQKWARTLVALALCSFRPLTILELGTTLAFDVDLEEKEPTRIISPNLLTELRQIFGSLFIARNSEIYFSHPSAHDFFIPPDLDTSKALPWFKFEGEGVAHAEIACFCLFYISLQAVQKEAAGTSSRHRNFLQSSISDSRNDLLSYATRYWPDHYKRALSLSPESESTNLTTQAVTKFFGDPETVFFWAKSYYDILNPFTRPEKPLSSILPIISSLNLLDFVQITSMHPYSDELDNHQSALLEAVRGDSFDTLRLLLESFSPSHSTLQDAIKVAASCAESRSLILLLDYVSKSKERLEWQQHLLFRAAGLGWDSVVKLLVESGVELNPPAVCSGLSPLHLAVRNNHIGVTKILLEGNASLTSQTLSGMNALHYACKYGRPDILRLIIQGKPDLEVVQAKPDLEINHKDQWSSLQLACYQGHHQIVELLLGSGADINYSEEKTPPLVIATQNGHIKCCRILLQHGANVKTKSEFHSPILMLAVQTENIDIINLLLDCEAEINEEDLSTIRSSTALSCAAAKGLKDIVSCLIKRNANVNRPEDVVERPVYVAAREGHHEVVELLIDAGAVMNIFNHSGWSPLHTAYDHPEVAHILLKKGADLNRASHDGTPLHLASKWNYPEVVKVYLQYKPDLEIKIETNDYYHGMAALCIATAQGNTEIVRMLLEHGAKPDQQSPKGEFPLLYALCLSSNRESEDITEALLDYNASLSMRNDYGDTALHYIRSHTPVSVVKLIVNAGADLEISNKLGITPICSAVKYGNVDVMKYLFSKGAQIDIVGGYWSGGPLHIACFLGLLEIIKFLIEKKANVNLENSGVAGTPLISACSSQIDDSELVDRKCETEQEIFDPDTAKYDYQDLDRPHTVNNPNVEIATNRQEGTRKQIIRYLIEEARAEVNLGSGAFGYPLHAACLQSTSEIVKFLLDHGARVDVEDYLGHKPIHFAAFHTLSTFDLILGSTQYASMKDKLGRIPLHYAVVSGRVELVKRVLDLSLEFVNASDCDEWTPLLWATRTCGRWRTTVEKQPEIIKLLLDAGADLWVRAKGLDREWSPLKVARYYGADDKVTDLLVPKSRKRVRNGVEEIWDEKFHLSRKAAKKSKILCDGCLHGIWGIQFKCSKCSDYDLCFKCYRSSNEIHPGHCFWHFGPEYEQEIVELSGGESVMSEDEEEEADEEESEEDDEKSCEKDKEENDEDEKQENGRDDEKNDHQNDEKDHEIINEEIFEGADHFEKLSQG